MNERIVKNLKTGFEKSIAGKVSIVVVFLLIIASIFVFLSPYDPNKIDITNKLVSPNFKHFFGTDDMGRDYFTRALYGGRVSLMVGFMSMFISTIIGTLIGTISGYFGGKIDSIMMRSIDVLLCIPSFFLILLLNAYLKPGIKNIIFIIGFFSWMGLARIVRGETLSIKNREYVLCSKALGSSGMRIVFKHIIPSVFPSVIVASSINIASAILMESSLSFLGLGVQQPNSSWGSMLQSAQGYIGDELHLALFPGFLIFGTVLSFNIIGDILRAAFDPKINT